MTLFEKYIPIVFIFLVITNLILMRLGINYAHYVFLVFCIVVLFIKNSSSLKSLSIKTDFFITVYLTSLIVMAVLHLFFKLAGFETIANSLITLFCFPLFWLLYLRSNSYRIYSFLKLIVFIGLVNAAITVVQVFVSPTLFGLYNYSDFLIENVGFRPGALLGSPQVNGLFLVLSSIVSLEIFFYKKKRIFLVYFIIILAAAFISGNKSVIFSLFLYVLVKTFMTDLKNIIPRLAAAVIGVIIFFITVVNLNIENRFISKNVDRVLVIFSDQERLSKGEIGGRIRIYSDFFQEMNIEKASYLTGRGIGYFSSIARSELINMRKTESYFFLILGEYGIIILIMFISIMLKSIYRSRKKNDFNYLPILIVLFFSFFYVHAFASPVFFLMWPLILAPLYNLNVR